MQLAISHIIKLFSPSDFLKGYKINYIPRYLIIDPSGNIVSPDAPRPSNPKLLEIFEELNI